MRRSDSPAPVTAESAHPCRVPAPGAAPPRSRRRGVARVGAEAHQVPCPPPPLTCRLCLPEEPAGEGRELVGKGAWASRAAPAGVLSQDAVVSLQDPSGPACLRAVPLVHKTPGHPAPSASPPPPAPPPPSSSTTPSAVLLGADVHGLVVRSAGSGVSPGLNPSFTTHVTWGKLLNLSMLGFFLSRKHNSARLLGLL